MARKLYINGGEKDQSVYFPPVYLFKNNIGQMHFVYEDLRIGSGFQGRESHPYDEHGPAEASKALLDTGWPEEQATDGEHRQARHESDAIAIASQDPTRDGQGTQKIGAKVRSGQARGHCGADVQKVLEVGVESIEEAISKAPEEEQDGHWTVEVGWISPMGHILRRLCWVEEVLSVMG